MTTFQKLAAWLLLSTVSLFAVMTGCKKDRVESFERQNQTSLLHSKITIEEAQNYFSSIDFTRLQASLPDSLKSPFRIKIEPDWGKAVLGNSQSGREIVLVPLADTTLFSINEGRARAQLVFSRSGPDTIFAQILLYAATPEYHASHVNNYNLNNFSGAFVFFDLFCNFQFGVALNAGSPISFVDSIGFTKTNVADDRTQVCIDYVTFFEICETWDWATINVAGKSVFLPTVTRLTAVVVAAAAAVAAAVAQSR